MDSTRFWNLSLDPTCLIMSRNSSEEIARFLVASTIESYPLDLASASRFLITSEAPKALKASRM